MKSQLRGVRGLIWLGVLLLSVALLTALGFAAQRANTHSPSCGWSTSIPVGGNKICEETVHDLSVVTRGEFSGDDAEVRRYVRSHMVASTIIHTGRRLRRLHVTFLQMAPDPALSATQGRKVSVTLYLVGKDDQGTIGQYQVVTEIVLASKIALISDQPNQDW